MLGTIFYAIGCFAVAAVISSLLIMMKPVHVRDESKPWVTFILVYLVVLAAPYGYCEFLTRQYGQAIEPAVKKAYASVNCNGPMRYFRLTSYHGHVAKALLVGSDKADWGGMESPVISVTLNKSSDGSWQAESYKVLSSGRLNQDCFVFPPYY